MAIIEEKKLDIQTLLNEYNHNADNRRLKDYYSSSTFFDIIGKGRNEPAHSAFLAWLFYNKNMVYNSKENAIIGLLDILMKRVKKISHESVWYNRYQHYLDAVSNALLSRTLSVDVKEVATEKDVRTFRSCVDKGNNVKSRGRQGRDDSLDIYIKCNVDGIDDVTSFEFFIENKIGSNEGGPKKDPKCEYDKKMQTERYWDACQNEDDKSTIQFFVFLKAASEIELESKDLCKSPNYIRINYQDIYDEILAPLLDSGRLANREQYLIEEYVKVLSLPMIFNANDSEDKESNGDGNPNVNTAMILAVSNKEKQALFEYWCRNKELILITIQSCYKEFKNEQIDFGKLKVKNKELVDKKECIKLAFEEFVRHVTIRSGYIERYIEEEMLSIPGVPKAGGLCYKIEKWLGSHKPVIVGIKENHSRIIIDKFNLDCKKTDGIEIVKKTLEKLYQDTFNKIKNDKKQILKIAAYFFNKEICKPIDGIKTIFEEDGSWNKASSEKYPDVYNCIKAGDRLGLSTYKCIVEEVTYDDRYAPALCAFWSVSKQLIMAAIRVISNSKAEEFSAEFTKMLKLLYRDFDNKSTNDM